MLLLVGLGNPGARYSGNRHNIGFMAVEAIASRYGFRPWREQFSGVISRGKIGTQDVMLLQPYTLMNDSGRAVAEAKHFFKLSLSDITVFHDEIDLPFGKVRIKSGGGIAGHNGLRSISEHIGNDYRRVRIGVGHPGDKSLVHHYVLSNFAKIERTWLETLMLILADNVELLVSGEVASYQNKIHLVMELKGFGEFTEQYFDIKRDD
jgi:peptidyl-tRNA hydrolase, PTH1 family